MIRHRLTASSSDHPAVRRYLRTGEYPVRGRSKHFSWDVWTHPERQRTPDAEAERVIAFISSLTHSKGPAARQPFRLRPWQEAIIRPLFGTLDEDGYRSIRTAFVFLPTRQGKTELAAAIMLYLLLGDGEQGGELFSVAVDIDKPRSCSTSRDPWSSMIPSWRGVSRWCRAGGESCTIRPTARGG